MLGKELLLVPLLLPIFINSIIATNESNEEIEIHRLYTIEGKVYPPDVLFSRPNWQANTRIIVNGGEYIGFVKEDGSFVIHNIPSGSYILEVLNSEYTYEPVRVEINTKGKFRARKVNHVQTSLVIQLPYPLKLKPIGRTKYFQIREQWRITDFLFSPMVLMMVLPLVFLMVLPKMLNDPETRKELEQVQSLTKFEMPEMTDLVSNFLAGQGQHQTKKTSKSSKKRQ
ncbi:ER membrane protein complex subunit 7 homolog [Agrilus planipennis]|uniref:ER membrane protein complex subunit 7 homolog n=1 Tax=Agrilus planipennis TaxID=224129 RepID=A0A1W4WJB0_AGRPL|nr:ER membrane protein complex subunit 7 homolog [Agrilus planipennis]